jgi:hypothetical protein
MSKNARGAGSIRQRPDGRWEARYSVGFNPATGRQIQKSIYGKTQKEVRQKLSAFCKKIKFDQWKGWLYLSPAIVLLLIFTVWPIFNTLRMSVLEGYNTKPKRDRQDEEDEE